MSTPLTRRQRRLLLTITLGAVFIAVAGIAIFFALRPEKAYKPGEQVDGLTSELSRGLPADRPRVTFKDVTREAGINFRHFSGDRSSQLPEDMGSGAAWGDYDGDGWPDLFLVNAVGSLDMTESEQQQSSARSVLYHNNQDGTFTDVTDQSGIALRVMGMGAEWGDYDNDGKLDLVISTFGTNVLYHNEGNGTFTDRSQASGIKGPGGFWSGVAWGDYDRDGFLDLYVTGYVKYKRPALQGASAHDDAENPTSINPSVYPPERNLLYHNNRNGTFTEVGAKAGVVGELGKSLEATWADFDDDGWPDLYVANDVSDNQLFQNQRNGTFKDISLAARVADYRGAMGLGVGDWDGDGDLDLFVTHWIAQENALYSNLSDRLRDKSGVSVQFGDEADRFGLGQIALDFVGFGTFFFDYDNDGRLDLFVANGHTFQRRDSTKLMVPETDQVFWNGGTDKGFYDLSKVSGLYFAEQHVGRGAAAADYDHDGDLDIIVVNNGGRAVLLRNDGGNAARWFAVQLEGRKSNRSAVGARVRIVSGGKAQIQEIGSQASYLSQNDLTAHFGLGADTIIDTLMVTWPSGAKDVQVQLAANQFVRLVEGEPTPVNASAAAMASTDTGRGFWIEFRTASSARVAGNLVEARNGYQRALASNPTHEDALYSLGNVSLELGEYANAESAWTRLVKVNPLSARAHSRLGDYFACIDRGAERDLVRAAAEYSQAKQINGEETGPILRLGEVAVLRGDLTGAAKHFDAVVGSHARSVEAQYLSGYAAWKQGRKSQALARFQAAAVLASEEPPAPIVAGEGDTKRKGGAPQLASTTRCRPLNNLIALPTAADVGGTTARMEASYRQLETQLTKLTPRNTQ